MFRRISAHFFWGFFAGHKTTVNSDPVLIVGLESKSMFGETKVSNPQPLVFFGTLRAAPEGGNDEAQAFFFYSRAAFLRSLLGVS